MSKPPKGPTGLPKPGKKKGTFFIVGAETTTPTLPHTIPEGMAPIHESQLANSAALAQVRKKYGHLKINAADDELALQNEKEALDAMSALLVRFVMLSTEMSERVVTSVEWQALALQHQHQWVATIGTINTARITTHRFKSNNADFIVKSIDTILARRPRNHQLVPRHAPLNVPIDNPDLGAASYITDDAVFGEASSFSIM